MARQQRSHVLDAHVAFDLGLDQVAEYAGDHQHQPERQADPGGLVQQERHRQHGGSDTEQQGAAQALPGLLGADRRGQQMLAEQHARGVAADVGEHDGGDHGEGPGATVVLEDQQRGEAREQRHPGGQQDRCGDVAQVVDRLLAQALADQAPHHGDHDRAAVGPERARDAPRPGQPDHRLPADQQRHDGHRVAVFA